MGVVDCRKGVQVRPVRFLARRFPVDGFELGFDIGVFDPFGGEGDVFVVEDYLTSLRVGSVGVYKCVRE